MKFFTGKAWRQHLADHREALMVARNNKPSDYERERLNRYRAVIRDLWEKHSKPHPSGEPGDSHFGQTWWCSGCRTPWPCHTARAIFAAEGFAYDYAPLRIPIRGEKRLQNAIELGAGHWMRVEGVEPDRCQTCHPLTEEATA